MCALLLGVAVPATAMDSATDSSGWLNWKTATGATVVMAAASIALYKWLKTPKAKPLSVSDFVKLEDVTEVDVDGFVVVKSQALTNHEPTLKLETQEDLHNALKNADNELAALEQQIAQENKQVKSRPHKPAGPKRTQKAQGNPQAHVPEVEVKPAQPAKRVQGQSHGVTTQALGATKLKKTGAQTTPAKK